MRWNMILDDIVEKEKNNYKEKKTISSRRI